MHTVEASAAVAPSPSRALYEGQDQMIQQDAYSVGGSVVDVWMGLEVGVESELWGAIELCRASGSACTPDCGQTTVKRLSEAIKKRQTFIFSFQYGKYHISLFCIIKCGYVTVNDCEFR